MNLNELTYFVTVVDEQGFSRAASRLLVSQPSLTLSIKQLETELGTTLLNRHRGIKNLTLTRSGKLVYAHAKKIIHETNLIIEEVANTTHERAKLGVPSIIGARLFPKLIPFLNPEILANLDFVETGSAEMRQLLLSGKLKMSIIGLRHTSDDQGFEKHFIMRDRYAVFVSSKSNLAKQRSVFFSDLVDERFVSLGKNYIQYGVLKELCIANDMQSKMDNLILSNEFETVNSLIANGAGIGIMTTYSLGNVPGITIVHLNDPIYVYFYLAFNKDQGMTGFEKRVKDDLIRSDLGLKSSSSD